MKDEMRKGMEEKMGVKGSVNIFSVGVHKIFQDISLDFDLRISANF